MPMVTRSKAKAKKTGLKRTRKAASTFRSHKKAPRPVPRLEKPTGPSRPDEDRSRSPEESQSQLDEDTVTAYKRNLNSALYQLPEEVTSTIMKYLTPGDLFLARQSCRLFWRLFEGPEFKELRRERDRYTGLLENWGVYPHNIESRERSRLRAIFQSSSFCEPCQSTMAWRRRETRERVRDQSAQPFYCSGCKRDHPGILFSIKQRQPRVPDHKRVCIGREGYVRLCKHKTISWLDIERALNHGDQTKAYEETIECRSEEHCPRGLEEDISPQLNHIRPRSIYPRVMIRRRCETPATSGGGTLVDISLEWTVLPLATQAGQQTTFPQLQRELSSYERTALVSPCNHESFSERRFVRAFDPNKCACLGFGLPIRHPPAECPDRNWRCCMCNSFDEEHRNAGMLLATKDYRFVPAHFSSCPECDTTYEWQRNGDAAMLSRKSLAWIRTPFDSAWIKLLDFDSYNLETKRNKHYLWCDDPACHTSRRWRNRLDVRRASILLMVGAWKSPRETALAKRLREARNVL